MSFAHRLGATRNAAALGALLLLPAAPARAEGGPQLILPLVAAIAAASAASNVSAQADAPGRRGVDGMVAFIPSQVQYPDVYANGEQDFIQVHQPRELVDDDRYVWIELPRPRRNLVPCLAYDQEKKGPLAGTGDRVSVILEYRF